VNAIANTRLLESGSGIARMCFSDPEVPFSFAPAYAILSAEGQVGVMAEDVLALNGLSMELLTRLSYRSQLGLSLNGHCGILSERR
jgi:hypothetical protein